MTLRPPGKLEAVERTVVRSAGATGTPITLFVPVGVRQSRLQHGCQLRQTFFKDIGVAP